ncbi:hypothetical protein AQI88_31140 [Streptomyces cellostaticus]|uniref:Uncharacterized protein n=1 Tax=Streptomyces cellostaticus TaxID=67285 RepID=A0A101NG73_9ACTN|nr:hypothetical protein [Streptomyces cellostaticus]KUM92621.1 hypothetical protein AQI88_31140 [Streptomyces cellostaticus]GHI10532.1 hypothetical protein Scel_88530 [Streptomyces cellostaticus]
MIRPEYAPEPDPQLNVQFLDSLVPRLSAGRYTLTAHQTLTRGGQPVDEGYLPTAASPVVQPLEVRAPRFGVEPEWIHGAYPPADATGLYSDVLPHVTLTRPTLPWERDGEAAKNGTRLPWLALLVFGEGEVAGDPHCLGRTDARTVAQLSDPTHRSPDDGPDVVLPSFDAQDPVPAEDLERVCRTVLVDRAVFHAAAPAKDELPYLTHVRRVNERHQGVTYSLDLIQVGDYAVVTGNRLPRAAGGRYVAHLVSLEGWLPCLPVEGEEAYDGPAQKLRLVSLWSWSFETLADHSPGFAALTEHFVETQGDQGRSLLLQVPVDGRHLSGPEQREVADRLRAGYLPLSCRTESGRATFGWYRGPFAPVPVGPRPPRDRRRCAAEAMIYLEQYGVFDVSLAVAFTAGRGVALADHQFSAALLRLRGKVRKAVESAGSAGGGPVPVAYALPGEGSADAEPDPLPSARDRLEHLVANGLAGHLGALLAAPFPVAAAAAPEPSADGPRTVGAAAPAPRAVITPLPAATELPTIADLTVRRLRTDAGLRARLGSALESLTGTPAPRTIAASAPADGNTEPATPDEDLTAVRDWLVKLRDLAGVPFAHLVPDARMLPPESLRFFHVDPDWTSTLVEGALSVGLAHSFDLTADDLLFGPDGEAPLPEPAAPLTGLLIRSQLVSGWPALEIRPYTAAQASDGERALPVLRRERLADDVLLVLIEGTPGRVEIAEPQQGVHFGIDEPDDGHADDPVQDGIIRLRSLTPPNIGQELDQHFPSQPGLTPYLRDGVASGVDNVLRVARLAAGLQGALGLQHPISSSEFAIQMINAAQRRTFSTGPRTTGDHHHA